MPVDLTPVEPNIHVGDKRVEIGSQKWQDTKALVAKFAALDLPLPNLATDALKSQLKTLAVSASPGGEGVTYATVFSALGSVVIDNVPVLYSWAKRHPEIVEALVRLSSNLNDDEVANLKTADMFRVARAAWFRLVGDGVFAEAAGFFLGLAGLSGPPEKQAPNLPSGTTADSMPASASASTPA